LQRQAIHTLLVSNPTKLLPKVHEILLDKQLKATIGLKLLAFQWLRDCVLTISGTEINTSSSTATSIAALPATMLLPLGTNPPQPAVAALTNKNATNSTTEQLLAQYFQTSKQNPLKTTIKKPLTFLQKYQNNHNLHNKKKNQIATSRERVYRNEYHEALANSTIQTVCQVLQLYYYKYHQKNKTQINASSTPQHKQQSAEVGNNELHYRKFNLIQEIAPNNNEESKKQYQSSSTAAVAAASSKEAIDPIDLVVIQEAFLTLSTLLKCIYHLPNQR